MTNHNPTGWSAGKLGHFIELKRGYDLPGRERRDGPYPIFSSSGPSGTHAEAKVKGPGVVTGRYGTIGEVFFIEGDYWPLNTALYVRDFKGNDPRFVSYFLRSIDFHKYVDKAAVPGVNRNHVHMEAVSFPPVQEQRRIAAILGALDDKIELNRKMNRTLEEMAQALFKSWFIDFDGHDDLVDSEIGPVPRGWKVAGLDAVADNVRDSVHPGDVDADLPYVGLEHVPRRCAALAEWGRAADVDSGKARFARGDLLFGKLRPYFHKVVPVWFEGVASTDILVVRPQRAEWRWFSFGHLFSDALVAHATAASDGTKMPRTRWSDLCRWKVAIPPIEVAKRFDEIAAPVYRRISANVEESRTLAALRDTLLPKLISGELRVPEAEKLVEAAS